MSSMTHLRWNSLFNGFMNEIWEVGCCDLSDQVIAVCAIEPRYTSLGLKLLLLTQFRLYQMYLSSQSSVLAIFLNQTIHQRALNLYQQLISEKAVTILSIIAIKAFFLCNTIYLIVDYFTFINSVLKLYWNTRVMCTI